MMRIFSCGQVAEMFGVHRDAIQSGIRAGAPEASLRVAGKRGFSENDILALRRWFQARGKDVKEVPFGNKQVRV
jgi:DNA-binding transcriptional MerR regulator